MLGRIPLHGRSSCVPSEQARFRLVALGACGGAPGSPSPPPSSAAILSLKIVVCPSSLLVGMTVDCPVVAQMPDGTALNVADQASWSSSSPSVVRVTLEGHVTAVAAGQAQIAATYEGRTDSIRITVSEATQDALIERGGGLSGQLRPGATVKVLDEVQYSVVSADSGELTLRVFDEHRPLGASAPVTVGRGTNTIALSVTVTIPLESTKLCQAAYLVVGPRTLVVPADPTVEQPLCYPLVTSERQGFRTSHSTLSRVRSMTATE